MQKIRFVHGVTNVSKNSETKDTKIITNDNMHETYESDPIGVKRHIYKKICTSIYDVLATYEKYENINKNISDILFEIVSKNIGLLEDIADMKYTTLIKLLEHKDYKNYYGKHDLENGLCIMLLNWLDKKEIKKDYNEEDIVRAYAALNKNIITCKNLLKLYSNKEIKKILSADIMMENLIKQSGEYFRRYHPEHTDQRNNKFAESKLIKTEDIKKLRVGDKIDALDEVNSWYHAEIKEITPSRVRVHYIGWGSDFDRDLVYGTKKIAQYKSLTNDIEHDEKIGTDCVCLTCMSKQRNKENRENSTNNEEPRENIFYNLIENIF